MKIINVKMSTIVFILTSMSRIFKDGMLLNSLINVVNAPTRINTLLDLIINNNDNFNFLDAGTIKVPSHISAHSATFIT